jgi:hypothetical protein
MRRVAFGAHRITDCVLLDSGFRRNDVLSYGQSPVVALSKVAPIQGSHTACTLRLRVFFSCQAQDRFLAK